jgi:pimeloyl-ACP methyl ester carboxylesterase
VRAHAPSRVLRVSALALAVAAGSASCNQSEEIREQALADSKAVDFEASDGVRLAGRIFGPETSTTGVVLAHMRPADQSSWFDFADRLGDIGYRVLTFDFRGYCPGGDAGCSEGQKQISVIWQDVQGAVDFLRSEGARDIALVGASMGGTASLIVAGQEGDAIDAVITLSAPEAFEGLAAGAEALQQVTAAKLFLAGNGDASAAQSATNFYNESLQPKRIEILTTSDHGTDLLNGNQAEIARNLIVGWLSQHLPVSGG